MNSIQEKLKKWLVPIANKIEGQVHIQAMKEGMICITPIIIVGSISLLFIALSNLLPSCVFKSFLNNNMGVFLFPNNFTMGIISIYSAFFIAYSLAKKYGLSAVEAGITAIISQFIVCGDISEGAIKSGYLDAQGLFVSILVAFIVVEIIRLLNRKNMVLKFPKEVPSIVSKSFNNLIPMIICVIVFNTLAVVTKNLTGQPIPKLIMNFLAPAINSLDSLAAVMIILLITQLLWFFGLHGAAITSSIWMPIATSYMAQNATAIASGGQPTHIFTIGFYYSVLQVTGSGITIGLVILMMRSKAKSFSNMGKVAFIPSIFGINEPVIFGTPIVMNPYMFIPFVFGPVILGGINYLMFSSRIIGIPVAEPPGFLPPGVGAFIMTLDWKAIVVVFSSIILMTFVYYPFFKVMEREELKKEKELKKDLEDDNFDF
ncbi:PTS system, cellobiose-specific IIC component [Clostridium cavendishii DSM 21758]|uniref:Permease IIC component n=1 Tax=Clostridium cavendishii DSM 21758 TaxID=1121302 RepID=A0A1M6QF20_9CLOT|nr:PTS transporter subunit EIIC [Clostridium cavendishii]SHK18647.1 PTS system, cellobiose-specific IIC component [Clostridium cavendishii DSM 21758]